MLRPAASIGTEPSGVANASTLGTARPRTYTRWLGPRRTTRRIVDRAGMIRAYALAAIAPEYTYPACGTTSALGTAASAAGITAPAKASRTAETSASADPG